jgi:hypothetical protein
MTTERQLVVNRGDVESCAFLAMARENEPGIGPDAADLYDELSDLLLYQPHGVAGREIRLIPASFKWPCFYRDMIAELLLDLGDAVSDQPVLVALAKHAAELVDNDLYSFDFRASCLDVLNELVAALKAEADGEVEVEP